MATLTEVSVMTRKIIMWVIIAIAVYLLLRVLFGFAVSYWKATHPVKVPGPNILFGPIPPPKFPDTLPRTSGLNMTILTIEGGPQEATSTGKVYLMPKKLPSLLAPQKARELAKKLKFDSEPEILSSSLYVFRDPFRTLNLDIVNNNFIYRFNYKNDPSIFLPTSTFAESTAKDTATNFFNSTGVVDSAMLSRNNVELFTIASSSSEFIPTKDGSQANAARVNYFRADIDSLPLLPPRYNQSYTYALVSPSGDELKRVVEADYNFWPIDQSNYGTYPLRSSDDAWKDIQDGKGVVATFGTNPENAEIIIREVYLAYYDSGLPETYLQPIFVFQGDNGFIAYTEALLPQLLDSGQ